MMSMQKISVLTVCLLSGSLEVSTRYGAGGTSHIYRGWDFKNGKTSVADLIGSANEPVP